MNDEINSRVVVLAANATKFTGQTLLAMTNAYLNQVGRKHAAVVAQRKIDKEKNTHGKMTVKDLIGQGEGATTIEIKDKDIKSFEAIARRYNVDFAVQKDKTQNPPKYLVYFKAKDTDVIAQAFREYVSRMQQKKSQPSLKAKLATLQQTIAKANNLVRTHQRQKERNDPSL